MAVLSTEYDEYLSALKLKPADPYYQIIKKGKTFLGIGGQHIYTIQLGVNKLIDEDQYKRTQQMAVLDKVANNGSLANYLSNFARIGSLHYQRYANAGNRYYKHHTPEVAIISEGVSKDTIKVAVEDATSKSVDINSYIYALLDPSDWCKYQFQQQYGYDIGKDFLDYNSTFYDFREASITLESNGTYTCSIKSITSIKCVTNTSISVEVANKNTTTDTVTTYKIQNKSYYRKSDNEFMYSEQETTVESVEDVNKGSVSPRYYLAGGSVTDVTQTSKTLTKTVSSFNSAKQYYLVEYTDLADGHIYYWLYDPATKKYPALSGANELATAASMFPATIIRDDFKYVKEDEEKATENMLKSLGLDLETVRKGLDENDEIDKVMDCYLVLGVSPSDEEDSTVSKVLYETVDYVYDTVGLRANSPYNLTLKQDMYNSTVVWTATAPITRKEKIMPVGSYAHTSGYQTVTTKYYVVCNASNRREGRYGTYQMDVKVRTIREQSTESGVITRKVVKTAIYKGEWFDRGAFPDFEEESWLNGTTIGLIDGTFYFPYTYYVESEPDEEGSVSYYQVTHYLETKLYDDGRDCISDSHEESTDTSVVMMLTKQVDDQTTVTHTLMDFIGNYTIQHPKGVSTIALNGKNPELIIPILKGVFSRLSVIDKTKLLDNSLYLQFYAYDHQYIKWYKTPSFLSFLKFIIVVIIILIQVGTAGSATPVTSVIWGMIKGMIIAVGISMAIELIIKYTDGFLSIILSAIAIVAGLALGGGLVDFGYLEICTLLATAADAFNIYLGEKMGDLQSAMTSFYNAYENVLDTFKTAYEDLSTTLSAYDYVSILQNDDYNPVVESSNMNLSTDSGLVEELTFFTKYNNPTEIWLQEMHRAPADRLQQFLAK